MQRRLETGTQILEKEIGIPLSGEPADTGGSGLNPDYLGAGGSLLCLIHCIAPQLIALGSVGIGISSFFAGEAWTAFFWLTCLLAVLQSARKSPFLRSGFFLWFSFAVFTLGIGYEFVLEGGHLLSYIGSFLLITAHLYNLYLLNRWKRLQVCRVPK